jgi:uncharacterized membrane protein YdjX (TVP38/TMEM64 family)
MEKTVMKSPDRAERSGIRSAVKGVIMLCIFGAGVWMARSSGLEGLLRDTAWFDSHVLGSGPMSGLIFMGITACLTALGLPRQLFGFLGGFAFGAIGGTLLTTVGCGLGCATASLYGRFSGRDFVARKFGSRLGRLDAFLSGQPFLMALAIRLFPLGSNLLTNLAAGVSSIPLLPFVLGSSLGYIPQNFVFALFGAGMNAESTQGVVIAVSVSVVLLMISGWLGVIMYRRYRAESLLEE